MTRPPAPSLASAKQEYPRAWQMADLLRADRGTDIPDWPPWCFLPMAGWYSIVSRGKDTQRLDYKQIKDVAVLAALGAWRPTQGIYNFDADLYSALISTPMLGDMPCDVLYRLPAWCVYIETPGLFYLDKILHGFYAHLEYDVNCGRHELRLLFDCVDDVCILPIHMGEWPLSEALHRMTETSKLHGSGEGAPQFHIDAWSQEIFKSENIISKCISLILYLCSEAPDAKSTSDLSFSHGYPSPKKTKKGWRIFPPGQPTIWSIGGTLGETLRAVASDDTRSKATHASPRPHIRRAHWHGYWRGPLKGSRSFSLKWMPPIAVSLGDNDD